MQREKIELVLLPPKDRREVTEQEIANFYATIIMILSSNN